MTLSASHPTRLRGYFGIGAEGISKPLNLANLMRSSHAFGASFFFTIAADKRISPRGLTSARSDPSNAADHMPYFPWRGLDDLTLPEGCELVGVELTEEAADLPSFRHPSRAAYVLGAERGALSNGLQDRCDHVVRIPTAFCINLAVAGAIIMYDRVRSLGRFPAPPVLPGGTTEPIPVHVHGGPLRRLSGADVTG